MKYAASSSFVAPALVGTKTDSADEDRRRKTDDLRDGQVRICAHCGEALIGGHGNRRYHPSCAETARRRKAAEHSRTYRARQHGQHAEQPPGDYAGETVTVRAVTLSGQRIMELRSALWPVMLHTMQNHLHLVQFKTRQMNADRMRLRDLVDHNRLLLDLLNEALPDVIPNTVYRDPELVRRAVAAGEDPAFYEPPPLPEASKFIRLRPGSAF